MKNLSNKIFINFQSIVDRKEFFPILFFFLIILSYGVLVPEMGFAGDDWTLIWDSYRIDEFNMIKFRPLVVLIYQILRNVLLPIPYQWFMAAIVFRYIGGLVVYYLFKELFLDYENFAELFALLYSIYPGCIVGYMPVHMIAPILQPFFLFFSFYLMVLWLRKRNTHNIILVISYISAALNLILTEYFFFLELLRPIIICIVVGHMKEKKQIKDIFRIWFPYLIIFIVGLIWRGSFLGKTNPYNVSLIYDFINSPLPTIQYFAKTLIDHFNITLIRSLIEAFRIPLTFGPRTLLLYFALVALISFLVFIYLVLYVPTIDQKIKNDQKSKKSSQWFYFLIIGIISFVLADLSFLITKLDPVYGFDVRNRFAVTQAFSMALLIFIPLYILKGINRVLFILVGSILIGSFAGVQFKGANDFRNEWAHQEEFFWHFAWRVPNLKSGSLIIMNIPDFNTIGDNALSAGINWNYVKNPRMLKMDYYVYFDDFHLTLDIPDYEDSKQLSIRHKSGTFEGFTNQTIVIQFDDSSCLRILDPEVEIYNPDIIEFTRNYMKYSNLDIIETDNYLQSGLLDQSIFRTELPHGWCYYFEKADLARQLEDWNAIEKLGNLAFSLDEHPNDAAEYLPFIEGYAHLGNWTRAIQLSNDMVDISLGYAPMNCALWKRINNSIPDSPEKSRALDEISKSTNCTFE
jgi:hypothetical protein